MLAGRTPSWSSATESATAACSAEIGSVAGEALIGGTLDSAGRAVSAGAQGPDLLSQGLGRGGGVWRARDAARGRHQGRRRDREGGAEGIDGATLRSHSGQEEDRAGHQLAQAD